MAIEIDLIDSGRDSVRDKPEKARVAVPVAAKIKDGTQRGHRDVGNWIALKIEELELRAGVFHVVRKKPLADDGCPPFNDSLRLRDNLFPICALGCGAVGPKNAETRRVFVPRYL